MVVRGYRIKARVRATLKSRSEICECNLKLQSVTPQTTNRVRPSSDNWIERSSAKNGPRSVVNTGITPPSGNKQTRLPSHGFLCRHSLYPVSPKRSLSHPLPSALHGSIPASFILPTPSIIPAAWTSCPYVVRDGHTNPDNTMSPNKNQLQQMCQSVLDNALAFALTGSSQYAERLPTASISCSKTRDIA